MKNTKYKVFVSDCYYINDGKSNVLEWATDMDKSVPAFTQKHVETHATIEDALNSVAEWGSKWVMYPSLIIKDEKGSEVYSDIPALYKCDCCKHEEWDRVTSDLRSMTKAKDGSKLFPELV